MAGRFDPEGKRALFERPVAAAPDQIRTGRPSDGKAALYSSGPPRAGTVLVECAGCETRTRLSLADVGLRLLGGSAWLPARRHNHWMRCPSCGHRTWCRIGWSE